MASAEWDRDHLHQPAPDVALRRYAPQRLTETLGTRDDFFGLGLVVQRKPTNLLKFLASCQYFLVRYRVCPVWM